MRRSTRRSSDEENDEEEGFDEEAVAEGRLAAVIDRREMPKFADVQCSHGQIRLAST